MNSKRKMIGNIYAASRIRAGIMTRDEALDRGLPTTYSMLSEYETGKTLPGENLVFCMAKLYNDFPMLVYEHMITQTQAGRLLAEQTGFTIIRGDIPEATLCYINEHNHIDLLLGEFINVISDKRIDASEEAAARDFLAKVGHTVGRGMGLIATLNPLLKEKTAFAEAAQKAKPINNFILS